MNFPIDSFLVLIQTEFFREKLSFSAIGIFQLLITERLDSECFEFSTFSLQLYKTVTHEFVSDRILTFGIPKRFRGIFI